MRYIYPLMDKLETKPFCFADFLSFVETSNNVEYETIVEVKSFAPSICIDRELDLNSGDLISYVRNLRIFLGDFGVPAKLKSVNVSDAIISFPCKVLEENKVVKLLLKNVSISQIQRTAKSITDKIETHKKDIFDYELEFETAEITLNGDL